MYADPSANQIIYHHTGVGNERLLEAKTEAVQDIESRDGNNTHPFVLYKKINNGAKCSHDNQLQHKPKRLKLPVQKNAAKYVFQ